MENVVRFPPRYLHPERSHLGREILKIARSGLARNVDDLARMTGANPAFYPIAEMKGARMRPRTEHEHSGNETKDNDQQRK
jgi:hypothetical protein